MKNLKKIKLIKKMINKMKIKEEANRNRKIAKIPKILDKSRPANLLMKINNNQMMMEKQIMMNKLRKNFKIQIILMLSILYLLLQMVS